MRKINILWIALSLMTLISLLGCQKKRISYTDMIKREKKEITAFMDKEGFVVLKDMPTRALAPNEFVQLKEGLYINVIEKGQLVTENKATVLTRFHAKSIGEREQVDLNTTGPTSGSTYPLPFIYLEGVGKANPVPNVSIIESSYNNYLCDAMIDAFKLVGFGGKVRMIVSFRYGPAFTSKEGIAIFFDEMSFNQKP